MFELLTPILNAFWLTFKAWWWVFPPFLLIKPFQTWWLWWKREASWKGREYVLLEIKMPEEVLKPIRAMERIFTSLATIDITAGDFREKWIEGGSDIFPPLSFELVGLGGKTYFFVRCHVAHRDTVESALYSQYSNIEIQQAEDYTKQIPQDIPNGEWDLEARDWVLKKESCYPLKTYQEFEPVEGVKEEKRIDPMAGLLEGFSTLQPGEQIWIQILLHVAVDGKWIEEGEKIRNKLVKRPGPPPPERPILQKAAELVIMGAQEEKPKDKSQELLPPEMMLTPGEREVVKKIEEKISKYGFKSVIRTIYLGKGDDFFKAHIQIPISFLKQFDTNDLNKFTVVPQTGTKVHTTFRWFLDKRRAFLRKRKIFRNYVMRVYPLFPSEGGTCVLNTEELASIFHFPGRTVASAPFVSRVEAKKGEAPAELPIG